MKNSKKIFYKPAFTMLELIMVIVVMGILASLAIPRLERDRTQEAADAILANIRYTQSLALSDYRQDVTDNKWQRSFWQIKFASCKSASGFFFQVGANKDYSTSPNLLSKDESAIDSSTGLPMFWSTTKNCKNGGDGTVSKNIFLSKKFGITKVTATGAGNGCLAKKHIGFDHLGRPHISFSASTTPDYSSYMRNACTFTFEVDGAEDFSIKIAPETGYAHIVGQNNS